MIAERLSATRLALVLDFPYYGQLALRLNPEITHEVPTAATDGRRIIFNPDFCAPLPDPQLLWLYAHEVMHLALLHPFRIDGRDPKLFNVAADYVVNELLEKCITPAQNHFIQPIPGALRNRGYDGLSVEEIYAILQKNQKDNPSQPPPESIGDFQPPPGDESKEGDGNEPSPQGKGGAKALEQEWKNAAANAAQVARQMGQGKLPAELERRLGEIFEPTVPWQDLLRQFFSVASRDDYSWSRPNRRYAHLGFVLPSLRSKHLGNIVVAVDTSGSIDEEMLKHFLGEFQGILDSTHPQTHLIDCDSQVHSCREVFPGDIIADIPLKGGGGTRFQPVFDHVANHNLDPTVLLYFTDMEGSFPDPPPYETLWINHGDPRLKAPFGQTIHISS